MDTIKLTLKSRTTWTIVAMFVFGGVQNITQFLPADVASAVTGALSLAAVYFKINPSQNYGDKK
jgi:hypothetical protein